MVRKKKVGPGGRIVRGSARWLRRLIYSSVFLTVVILLGFFAWSKIDPASWNDFLNNVVRPLWNIK